MPCLTERYSVVRDLGAGGESDVLLVRGADGGDWVVKQYRQQGWSPSMDVLDWLDDLRVGHTPESWAADERTRGVVWLQEWGTDPATGLFFEVQEFIECGDLAGARANGLSDIGVAGAEGQLSRLGEWEPRVVAGALVEAVAGFHLAVGAHRDIKPANLLVRSADPLHLVLADVVLSRNVGESSSRFSKRDGAAAYQAPEAAQGAVSRAGNWWAVGMIVAEAAIGRHPLALPGGSLPDGQVLLAEVAQRDVPLDGISDLRVLLLCRGLLARDSEKRWRLPQVRAWQAGESPATG